MVMWPIEFEAHCEWNRRQGSGNPMHASRYLATVRLLLVFLIGGSIFEERMRNYYLVTYQIRTEAGGRNECPGGRRDLNARCGVDGVWISWGGFDSDLLDPRTTVGHG